MRPSLSCIAAVAALTTGCSSAGSPPPGSAPAPVTVAAHTGGANAGLQGVTLVVGGNAQTIALPVTQAAVWPHLVAAYESIGIPLTYKVDAAFRLGNAQFKARRAINNIQLRSALDCGSDLSGEKAETYEIRLTIESSIAAAGTGSELTTNVTAIGRSASVSGSDVTCSTKGEFERRIQRYIRIQLGLPNK